jgi:hypothetical protein
MADCRLPIDGGAIRLFNQQSTISNQQSAIENRKLHDHQEDWDHFKAEEARDP